MLKLARRGPLIHIPRRARERGYIGMGRLNGFWANASQYKCDAADFDGTNDVLLRGAGLTGAADSKTGIFSGWVRLDGGNATAMRLIAHMVALTDAGNRCRCSRQATNVFLFTMTDAAGATQVQFSTVNTYLAGPTWLHVLASWNAGVATHLYVNDVSDITTTTNINTTLDYTTGQVGTGGDGNSTLRMNGCFADFYWAPGQFLDFSVTDNRRKFIDARRRPVNLGSDGSRPTGTAPLIFHHLDKGEAANNFALNRGTGGDFTVTGSLDTASTSPTD